MQSKIYGSTIGGDRLGTLQSATECTRYRVSQTPICYTLISLSSPVRLSWLFNFFEFLCNGYFCSKSLPNYNQNFDDLNLI